MRARSNLDRLISLEDQGLGQLLINECIKGALEERWGTHFKENLRETKRHEFQEFPRESFELKEKGEGQQEKGHIFQEGERACIPRLVQH
jgi:hypothetical protein